MVLTKVVAILIFSIHPPRVWFCDCPHFYWKQTDALCRKHVLYPFIMVISAHFYLPLISQEGHIHSVKQANIPTLEILKDMTVPSASVLEFSGTHPSGHFSQNFHPFGWAIFVHGEDMSPTNTWLHQRRNGPHLYYIASVTWIMDS